MGFAEGDDGINAGAFGLLHVGAELGFEDGGVGGCVRHGGFLLCGFKGCGFGLRRDGLTLDFGFVI